MTVHSHHANPVLLFRVGAPGNDRPLGPLPQGRLGHRLVLPIPPQFAHLQQLLGSRTFSISPADIAALAVKDGRAPLLPVAREARHAAAERQRRCVQRPLAQRAVPTPAPQRVQPRHWRVQGPDAHRARPDVAHPHGARRQPPRQPVAQPQARQNDVSRDDRLARKFLALGMSMPLQPLPFTDANRLTNPRKIGEGGFNSVYAVTYRGPNGQPLDMVFKPLKAEEQGWVAARTGIPLNNPNTGGRNLATVEVAKLMGCAHVVPKTELGTTTLPGGQSSKVGLVMQVAKGKPAAKTSEEAFRNGATTRDITWLQWLDHLTAQGDRHGNNYMISPEGKVMGIDNDQCFGKRVTNPDDIRYEKGARDGFRGTRMPPVLDRDMAASIERMTEGQLAAALGDKLTPEEVSAAKARLQAMKQHVKTLRAKGLVIHPGDWGKSRIQAMLNKTNSYVGRDRELAAAAAGKAQRKQPAFEREGALRQFQRLLARNF